MLEAQLGYIEGGVPLVVPAHPQPDAGPDSIAIETRQLPDGQRVVVVFTSPKKLAAALGEFQPWIALPVYRVREMLPGMLVLIDPEIEFQERYWNSETLAELAKPEGDSHAA